MKNFSVRGLLGAICLFVAFAIAPGVKAQYTPGNLVVYRVGDGTTTLTSAAFPINLIEVNKLGISVGSALTLPTSTSGSNSLIAGSGTASSEGALNLSVDGRYLTLGGYGAVLGTASVGSTGGWSRVVARIDGNKTINTTTALTDAYTNNNYRSVVSDDGTHFWLGGNGSSTTGGVRYVSSVGSTTSTQVSNSTTNTRNVSIYGGKLYVTSGSGSFTGVSSVGTGIPTTSGQAMSLVVGSSDDYAFVFFDRDPAVSGVDLLYIAHGTLGVQKFSWNGSVWTAQGAVAGGVAGLTGFYNPCGNGGAGNIELYATTFSSASTGNNSIIKIIDNAAYNAAISTSTSTTVASAGSQYAFRGIAFAPGTSFTTPIAYNVTGGGAYCGTTAVAIGLSNSETGMNYQLYRGVTAVGSPVAGTGSSLAFTAQTIAGTYTVIATNALTNCTTTMSGSAVVTVNTPTVANAGASQTITTGSSATLTANTPATGTGSWSVTSGPSTVSAQFSSTTNPAATFTPAGGAGTYALTWTISNTPCTPSSSTVAITVVLACPTITATLVGTSTICTGSSATLTATITGGTSPYSLTYSNGTSTSVVSGTTIAVSPTTSTTYTLVAVTDANGCSATISGTAVVTVNQPPTTSNAGASQTIAVGGMAALAANSPTVGSGVWTVTSGPSAGPAQFSSNTDPMATFRPDNGLGDYVLTWTISNAPCPSSSSSLTITVTKAVVNLTVSSNTASEASPTAITVTATASAPVQNEQTVSLAVTGTGITVGDYTLSNTTVTIPNGQTAGSVTFTVVDDNAVEGTEIATLTINNPSGNITLGSSITKTITITDNDVAPGLSISDVSLAEGNTGTTTFSFTVSLATPAPAGGVTFDIATADNSATQPSDYAAKSLTGQIIPEGGTAYTFNVLVKGDTDFEPNETFFVNVSNVTGATVSQGQGTGTITNDDPQPLADLTVGLTDSPDPVVAGNSLTYSFTVSNTGTVDAANTSVAFSLPAGTTFTSLTVPAGWSTTTPTVGTNGTVTADIASLMVGSQATFALVVTPTVANPTLSATVSATTTTPESNSTNNSATTTTTVSPANQPPVAPTFVNQTGIVAVPFSYTVPAFTDPESQTLTYTITGLPAGLVADNTSRIISGTPTTSSTSTVTVVATDPQSATTVGTFTITINANAAPVSTTIANQTATVGMAFSYTVPAFSDPENQPLIYAASGLPVSLTFNATTRVISGTPSVAGVSFITITATDPASNTASTTFTLSVTATPAGIIRITEFMYNGPTVNGTAGEFVELTNVGNASVDLTGWSLDDNNRTPGLTSLSSLGTVQPGESVIVTEASAADFRTFWYLPITVKVLGGRTGHGFGNGDEINIYDNTSGPGSSTTTTPVDRLTYPSSGTVITNGVSAWTTRGNLGANNISGWQLSVLNDAQNSYRSTVNNLGNPGGYYMPLNRVLVRESGGNPGTTAVTEGGATDTYTVALNSLPTADVTITITPGSQLTLNTTTLTFTPANYSTPQTVTVTAVDDAIVNGTRFVTITQSVASSDAAYNGIAINPVSVTITDNDVAATAPPSITAATTTTRYLSVSAGTGYVSGVINDPTDPASTLGIDFTLSDADTPVNSLTTTLSINNSAVVPIASAVLTGTGGARNLKITPVGVGYATITVAVTDGVTSVSYVVNYAASATSGTTASTRFHTGTSDASTAILVDGNYTLVGDDENQVLRLYNRQNSGLPVAGFDFTASLGLTDVSGGVPREVDLEASILKGNRIFWIGSQSNKELGPARPNRDRVFATDITGTGAGTTLSYVGRYDFLREDIINWDVTNGHGKGANYYGLQTSADAATNSKAPEGYNIEGAELAPDGTTAYIGFRAPQVLPASRTKALIVAVTNLTTLVSGQVQGSATFGAPIELNLGGRGIREIRKNANNEYLVIAGPAGDATGTAPADFRLFTWTGNAADAPIERNTNLTALNANGSFESIVEVPASLSTGVQVQLLVDNGDAVFYNDGIAAKDLSQNNFKKFRSELITLGAPLNTAPTVANAIPPQSATVNQAFSYTIPANTFADAETPGNLTLTVAGLPSSLSLNGTTISGTPSTTVGSPYSVTLTATDPGSLSVSTVFSLSVAPAPTTPVVSATGVVISQVYGGGGNSGATYRNDFVELFNRSSSTVSINGWSVQYTSATGTGSFSANSVSLTGSLAPGQYYLVQLTSASAVGGTLPTPDATGNINLSNSAGKVILVNSSMGVACNGSSTTCTSSDLARIVDLVGYGTANYYEGSGAAPGLTNTTAAIRKLNGCTDTDNNAADFTAATPVPHNTASPVNVCGAVVATLSANPTTLSGFNATVGTVSNTQTYTLTGSNLGASPVSVSATANIELSTDNVQFSATLSLPTTASAISQVIYARLTNTISTTGAFSGTITNTANGTLVASVSVSGQVNPVNAPSLSANPTALTGFTTTQGTVSTEQTYTLTAANLSSAISVSAPTGVEVSSTSGSGFGPSLTLPMATTSAVVYVWLTGTTAGPINRTISNTSGNLTANVTITGTVSSTSPYTPIATARAGVGQTFTVQGRVTVKNQLGSRQIYIQDETGGIAVYSGSSGTDFSTLVEIGDLVQTRGPVTVYNGYLELTGTNNFTVVTSAGRVAPTPLAVTPDQLSAHQGELVTVANNTITPAGTTFAGGSSYTITASGQSGILYINPNSELSGAGRPANPVSVTGISDRYVSLGTTTGTDNLQLQPRIITDIAGATAPTDQTCTIAGNSTLTRDQTLDIAAWNMEFFGADAGTISCPSGTTLVYDDKGPTNEDLQQSNAVKVLTRLNADIISTEEVSDIDRFAAAVQAIPGSYSYVCSDKFSYFFQDECDQVPSQGTVFGPTKFAQKVCVIYNTATVTPVLAETKPLLFKSSADYTYPGAIGGNGSGSGWASGRLPFLFVANVTINGITKKMHIVAVHGKSGSAAADFNRRVSDYNDLKAELDRTYPTANIVMLGDYNDKATSSIYTGSPISSFNSFVTDVTNYGVVTKPLEQNGCVTYNPIGGSFIDHIIISNDLQPAYVPNSVYVLQPFSIPNYGNTTSDHSPLEARFDLSKLADPVVASLSGNTTVCAGASAVLSVSITGGTSPYSVVYAANGTSTTVSGYSSGAPITVSPAVSTTYTLVAVTDAANASANPTGTVVVTVNPAVTAVISGNLTVCTGASTILTASGGSSFTWSTGETTAAISVSTAGTYSVTVMNSGGCAGSTSVSVTVGGGITAGITGSLTVCSGASTLLTATGGNSFTWSTGETTASIPATAGAYSVTVASGNCTASTSATVTSVANPTAAISGNLTVCSGQSTTLTASGGTSYLWSNGQTTASISAVAGPYSVTATQTGCSASASVTVTSVASPTASISGTLTVTSGGSTMLTATGGTSFTWSTGQTTASISVTAGTYSVTVGNGSGCISTTSATVTTVTPVVSATGVVISQVYGGGGNSGATYLNDFVELFNRTSAPISVNGWSIQYTSPTGTGSFSANVVSLTGTIGAGKYYLIQLASNAAVGSALPTPDATGSINMGAGGGKVALVNSSAGIACNGSSTSCTNGDLSRIVDLVGYGNANYFEGSGAAPTPSATLAVFRLNNGCTDTNNNAADFMTGAPAPRNSASPANVCGAVVATLVASPTALSGFNATVGTVSNTQTYMLTGSNLGASPVSVSATANIELSTDNSQFSATLSLPTTGSAISQVIYVRLTNAISTTGAFTGSITNTANSTLVASVSVSGQVNPVNAPSLSVNPTALTGFTATQGTASAPNTFTVSGSNLTPSTITVTASQGIEISLNPATDGYTSQFTFGNLPNPFNVQVYARLAANASVGMVTGTIVITGSNSTSATVAVSGTVSSTAPVSYTRISQIQGSGSTAALTGTQTIEGIVTRKFTGTTGLNGFYVQEEDADSDNNPATSEGIFVFDNTSVFAGTPGDKVRITGAVTEFVTTVTGFPSSSLTEITLTTAANITIVSTGNPLPSIVNVQLPVANVSDLERYEGMLINMSAASGNLTVTEYFQLGRYGQVVLSATGATDQAGTDPRLDQYTQFFAPSVSGYTAYLAEIAKRRIYLDDGRTDQNPDPIIFGRGGQPLSASNTLRGGDNIASITAILDERSEGYRLQTNTGVNFQPANPRPATPPVVGGTLKAGSFNVLNYFTTFGTGNFTNCAGNAIAGRGADNQTEFTRQRDKVIGAIINSGVDVMGLNEIQNNGFGSNSAIQDLVNGLNAVAGANSFTYVNSGCISTDAITVAMIYKPAKVTPVGSSTAIPFNYGTGAFTVVGRRALAQTFQQNSDGAVFTLVANHWKSKGSSSGGAGDADANDGQSASNGTRTRQAQDLVSWLNTKPTGTTDPDYLIVGDLNSYAKEDPLTTLEQGGYTNLVPNTTYSYVFDGFVGALDHALRSASLQTQVTGADKWHINSDEPSVLDYNTNFKTAGQISSLYSAEPYRASDHDPVLIGLNLTSPTTPLALTLTANPTMLTTSGSTTLSATVSGGTSPYSYTFTGPGTIVVTGNTATVSSLSAGVQTFTVVVRDATSPTSQSISGTVSVTVTQANTPPTVANSVPPQSATVGIGYTLSLANTFTDAQTPGNLTITATSLPAGLSLTGTTISGTPSTTVGSPVSVTLAATDPGGLSASTVFTITVSPAPVAVTSLSLVASANPTVMLTTGTTTLSAMVSGGTGPYNYTFSGPGTITPSGNTASVSSLPVGVQTFTVVVTDATSPTSQSISATVSVTVIQANTAPVATATANQTATVGVAVSYTVNAFTDAETPNSLTYSASIVPANGFTFNPATRVITGTPSVSGVSSVTVTATDPGGLSASTTFTIMVKPASITNTAPTVANAVSPQSGTVNMPYTLSVANTFTDTETPNSLTLSVAGLPASLSLTGTTISGTPSTTVGSPYSVTVTATDPGGLTASTVFSLSVVPAPVVNTAPTVANAVGPQSGTVGVGYTLSVANVFTDAETPGSLALSVAGLPGGLSLSGSSISGSPSMSGVSSVTLTATDPGNLSASTVFTLTVSPASMSVTPTPTGPFAITGVTTVSCTTVSAGQRSVRFTPQYAGVDGSSISFSVVNELGATTSAGPYTLNLYTDNPVISLQAVQSGVSSSFAYNWLAACNGGGTPPPNNTAPTVANAVGPQSGTVGVGYTLSVANVFTDAETPGSLALSVAGLPGGLSLSGSSISGSPSMSGVSSVTLTATDPGNLSASTVFTITVSPASMSVTPTPTGPFAITGVTTVSCTTVSAGQRSVRFTPQYAGVDGSSISFSVVNELGATTSAGPYTLNLYTDNPVISLQAVQSGVSSSFAYNWLAACNGGGTPPPNNTAPTVANAVGPQSGTVGVGYTLSVANVFTDAETPGSLALSVAGLPGGLSLSGSSISGSPSMSGVSSVTLTATDPGNLSASTVFTITVSPASMSVTPTPTGPFAITGVTTVSCTTVSAGQRSVRFTPQYAGVDGSSISFSVVNELGATTSAGPYTLNLYTDNPVISLQAVQSGVSSSFAYNWLAACNGGGTPPPNNTAPTVANAVGPQSGTVGVGYTLSVANVFTDAETPGSLALSVAGLPGGLSLSGSSISGSPSMSGVSSVTLTATDPGNLSASTVFTITVSPASMSVTPTPTGPFAITGVTTVSCTTVSAGQRSVRFTPQYAGVDGSSISFSVVNELGATTSAGPYTLNLYTDNPVISLQAVQSGVSSSFAYNWLAACNGGGTPPPNNTAPTVANAVGPQSGTVGVGYTLSVANVFTDAETPGSLALSVAGLPGGLSLSGSSISGSPSMSGVSSVTLTATDPGNLSASTVFTITVSPASMSVTPTPTGPFAITGVTTVSCTTVSAGQRSVRFTPQYAGVDGSSISFSVVNELGATTSAGPYTLNLYTDNPVISLQAVQSGVSSSFAYNWLAACNGGGTPPPNNTAPTVANAVGPQSGTVGVGYTLSVANVFTDAETPGSLALSVAGLPGGLSLSGSSISGSPSTTVGSPFSVTLTATDPGNLSASTVFTLTVSPASMSVTPTPTGPFAITGVTTVSCTTVSAGQRSVRFTPQYAGVDGSSISFSVVNELGATTSAGPYTLNLYTDNPVISLQAVQSGVSSSFAYNWLVACNSLPVGSRQSAVEPTASLSVRVLGNPISGETVGVEIRGATGQQLVLKTIDSRGHLVSEQVVGEAQSVEQQTIQLGRSAGIYILQVSIPTKAITTKILKR